MTAGVVEAAQFERDWRAERYPARIAAGESDAEAASVDYQCWVAIAEWIETERFASFAGGADPDGPNAPIIRWPELELAAESALISVSAKLTAMEGKADARPETVGALRHRRSCLFVIHRKVQLRRQSIDTINADLRAGRQEIAA